MCYTQHDGFIKPLSRACEAFRDLRPFFDAGNSFVGHWREYTVNELAQMVAWSGLTVLDKKNYRTSPLFNGKDRFPRNVLLAVFRLLADCVPSARETNLVLGQKTGTLPSETTSS